MGEVILFISSPHSRLGPISRQRDNQVVIWFHSSLLDKLFEPPFIQEFLSSDSLFTLA